MTEGWIWDPPRLLAHPQEREKTVLEHIEIEVREERKKREREEKREKRREERR